MYLEFLCKVKTADITDPILSELQQVSLLTESLRLQCTRLKEEQDPAKSFDVFVKASGQKWQKASAYHLLIGIETSW